MGPESEGGSKSTWKIMANIFISFIGAGILGLPFAFAEVCCPSSMTECGVFMWAPIPAVVFVFDTCMVRMLR